MRSMRKQITILSAFMAIVIIVLTLGGLQLFGKGKVKPSEWFKKANTKVEQAVPDASDHDKIPDEDKQPPTESDGEQVEHTAPVTASAMRSVLLASNDGISAQAEETTTYATAEEARNSLINEGDLLSPLSGVKYFFTLRCNGADLGTVEYFYFSRWPDGVMGACPSSIVISVDLNEYLAMGYSNFRVVSLSNGLQASAISTRIMSDDGYLTFSFLYKTSTS